MSVRLGRKAVRHDHRTLRLARYLTSAVPSPPSSVRAPRLADWPMYGNDTLGDCTIAAAGHMIQAWTADAGHEQTPAEADVLAAYWATGSKDDGRVELDVLNYWRTTGVGGHKIAAYAAVDPRNRTLVRTATWLFGGLYVGVALPRTAQGKDRWTVGTGPDGEPGSWGGHAVPIVGYSSHGVTVVTWGRLLHATWAFLARYMDESYAVLSPDLLTAGRSPQGFDLAALQSDLASL